MTALWREIHLLEERVEVLENTLEASREQIAKTEEKYSKLHKQGNTLLLPFPRKMLLGQPVFISMCGPTNLLFCCCFHFLVEKLLMKQFHEPPLDAANPPGTCPKFF